MFDGTVDGEVFGLNGNIDDSATFRDGLGSMTHCPGSKSYNFVTQNLDANQGKKVLIVYTCIYNKYSEGFIAPRQMRHFSSFMACSLLPVWVCIFFGFVRQ